MANCREGMADNRYVAPSALEGTLGVDRRTWISHPAQFNTILTFVALTLHNSLRSQRTFVALTLHNSLQVGDLRSQRTPR